MKKVDDKTNKKQTKSINLFPQNPKEVLAALLKTPRPKDEPDDQNEAVKSPE